MSLRRRISSMSIKAVFSSTHRRKIANRKSKVAHLCEGVLGNIFHHLLALNDDPDQTNDRGRQLEEPYRSGAVMFDMCLVCRGWLTPARLVLYEQVWAGSVTGARSLLRSLEALPELCEVVKSLAIPPMWLGTLTKEQGGWTVVSFEDPNQKRWILAGDFRSYLATLRLVAVRCPRLDQVKACADPKYMEAKAPGRSPRIEFLLDLAHTHKFLRKLELDDGGMHKSTLHEIFPDSVKFDHLEELSLRNYIFASPPRYVLFTSTSSTPATSSFEFQENEMQRRMAAMPRLKSLRLIHCTSDDAALLPLTRHISRTLKSLTIVQRREKYSCAEEANGDRWHAAFAHNDVFAPLSKRITHLSLSMENYGPSYYLSLSSLQGLHLRARKLHRSALMDIPSTIRHLSLTIIEEKPDWDKFGLGEDMYDFFDDLSALLGELSLMNKIPSLKILDLNLAPQLRRSVLTWIKIYKIFKLCRRGRVFFRVRMTANPHPWGKPLPFHGRAVSGVDGSPLTTPTSAPSSPVKDGHGFRRRFGLK